MIASSKDDPTPERWMQLLGDWSDATPEEARRLVASRSWVVLIGVTVVCTLRSTLDGDDLLEQLWGYPLEFDGEDWGWVEPAVLNWEQQRVGDLIEHKLVIEMGYEFHDVQYSEIPTSGETVSQLLFELIRPKSFNPPNDSRLTIHEMRAWPIDPD